MWLLIGLGVAAAFAGVMLFVAPSCEDIQRGTAEGTYLARLKNSMFCGGRRVDD